MLRRYLIMDVVTTAGFYVAVWAFVPSPSSMLSSVQASFESIVMGHTLLSPMIDHMIVISASLADYLSVVF
jgi:hypothetical protein